MLGGSQWFSNPIYAWCGPVARLTPSLAARAWTHSLAARPPREILFTCSQRFQIAGQFVLQNPPTSRWKYF
jgi:hypothetical protein